MSVMPSNLAPGTIRNPCLRLAHHIHAGADLAQLPILRSVSKVWYQQTSCCSSQVRAPLPKERVRLSFCSVAQIRTLQYTPFCFHLFGSTKERRKACSMPYTFCGAPLVLTDKSNIKWSIGASERWRYRTDVLGNVDFLFGPYLCRCHPPPPLGKTLVKEDGRVKVQGGNDGEGERESFCCR